ncbi:MAG: hypothetical protein FJ144_05555 [Deltaproteobacteria bacterium]|nr:hypothetical protein [Deltaproteobacteria bacterium]
MSSRSSAQNGFLRWLVVLPVLTLLVACGGGGGSGGGAPVEPPPPPGPTPSPGPVDPTCEDGGKSYDSTFEAIQDVIFERHGCTQDICHGSAASGGLDLRPDVAYDNVYERPSTGSSIPLVTPGDRERSYLWLKVAAKTQPGQWTIAGSPMPNNLPAISDDDLELLRLWIYAGAPESETVLGSEDLIDGCLPDPGPITIEPLDPPEPGTGVQFVMPPWDLAKGSEFEGCLATYYDFTDQTPEEFKDPTGALFRFRSIEVRQDPQSHHLLLYYSPLNLQPGGIDVNDESFGTWTCYGGVKDGEVCDPKDIPFCGENSVCGSELVASFACNGYGPPTGGEPAQIVGGAPSAQSFFDFPSGVFQQLSMKGVLYWNAHAFNLTTADHQMNGRVNYYFATEQVHQTLRISNFSAIARPNNPPFTRETFCQNHVFPIGSRVFHLFGHNHQRGERFWVTAPDGTMIYENFDYSDPVQGRYDPPLAFDSPNPADRTAVYCGTYNNGLREDGSFDPVAVTRSSRVPPVAQEFVGACKPVACVNEGMIGEPCNGEDDDAACDTSPGAGDGFCDACNITFGESTENEMFVLFGAQFIDPTVPGAEVDLLPYPIDEQ